MGKYKHVYLSRLDMNDFGELHYRDEIEYVPITEYNELVSRFNELQQERDRLLRVLLLVQAKKV